VLARPSLSGRRKNTKNMSLLILTGPPAAGKNTIAEVYVKTHLKCAVIDVDDVRQMLKKPHRAPWEGKAGHRQQLLGARNAIVLTKNFIEAEGVDVLILDVLTEETARMYKRQLAKYHPKIILLSPSLGEVQKRNVKRGLTLKPKEILNLFEQQSRFALYDLKIDNSRLSAAAVVKKF
jgi:predicted kinase